MSIWGSIAKFAGHAFAPLTGGSVGDSRGRSAGKLLDQVGHGAQGAAQSMAGNRGNRAGRVAHAGPTGDFTGR
jgi:hypothetical protein